MRGRLTGTTKRVLFVFPREDEDWASSGLLRNRGVPKLIANSSTTGCKLRGNGLLCGLGGHHDESLRSRC